ncbi:hypothetical protein [Roseomonas elaeocarpi]|uniref:Uncharacterized protein n=1 Tax=Roseomonas elaeocarpi TaxID=907779 RepID=A0ABV6JZ22_9PROT
MADPKPAKATDQNATATTEPTENLNQAGTAPKDPDQATVADAHAKHEAQRDLAERTEATKWDNVRAGMNPREALSAAQRSTGPAPENKADGPAPENKSA